MIATAMRSLVDLGDFDLGRVPSRRALILDCDGVLIDGEQTVHLRAFNAAFADCGVQWHWSGEDYAAALTISGGKERLLALCADPAFRAAAGLGDDPADWRPAVDRWHARKTEIYVRLIERGAGEPRRGVR